MSESTFDLLKRFMFDKSANVLKDDQAYLVPARLGPLMQRFGYDAMERMVHDAYHGKNPALARAILDAMTTHETQFFRDPKFWTDLSQSILPPLLSRVGSRRGLRIWSAGCSTGQEAYSLAMLLDERFPQLATKTTLHATDVSEAAIATAKQGVYAAHESGRGIEASRLVRHFDRTGDKVRVKQVLRDRIRFTVHNLKDASPFSEMDLVLCRNVLIYFSETDRTKIVERLAASATADGYLVLGSTESLPGAVKAVTPGCYEARAVISRAGGGSGVSIAARPAADRKSIRPNRKAV
jgi:chemotaxis protein methyltransferase CheR